MGELDLIRWIQSRLPKRRRGVLIDSGDDAALVRLRRRDVLLKTDSVIDGIHFDSRTARPEEIGHKAIARSLSDIAAMAGVPTFAVVAMMVPRTAPEAWIKRVILGMERTADRFKVAIVGGDLKSHRGKLAIAVALLGEVDGPPVRRSGAGPGDLLAVTGPLGGSILGKHLRFTPRVREALGLRRRVEIHAMIDLSDGLSTDLRHLCEASGVGAVIEESRVPISAAARRLSRKDRKGPLFHALSDGEDYELLFALPARHSGRVQHVIGTVQQARQIVIRRRDGSVVPMTEHGWEYAFGQSREPGPLDSSRSRG